MELACVRCRTFMLNHIIQCCNAFPKDSNIVANEKLRTFSFWEPFSFLKRKYTNSSEMLNKGGSGGGFTTYSEKGLHSTPGKPGIILRPENYDKYALKPVILLLSKNSRTLSNQKLKAFSFWSNFFFKGKKTDDV